MVKIGTHTRAQHSHTHTHILNCIQQLRSKVGHKSLAAKMLPVSFANKNKNKIKTTKTKSLLLISSFVMSWKLVALVAFSSIPTFESRWLYDQQDKRLEQPWKCPEAKVVAARPIPRAELQTATVLPRHMHTHAHTYLLICMSLCQPACLRACYVDSPRTSTYLIRISLAKKPNSNKKIKLSNVLQQVFCRPHLLLYLCAVNLWFRFQFALICVA